MTDKGLIYVVDDDSSICRSISRLLSANGFQARCFGTAEDFLRAKIDDDRCLILDIQLPGMSGLELIGRLGNRQPRHPVILISGGNGEDLREKGMALGALALLSKPFGEAELMDQIESLGAR